MVFYRLKKILNYTVEIRLYIMIYYFGLWIIEFMDNRIWYSDFKIVLKFFYSNYKNIGFYKNKNKFKVKQSIKIT